MEEDSFASVGKDSRNILARKFNQKKRFNEKEEKLRSKHMDNRDQQRLDQTKPEEIKEEFDSATQAYQQYLERKKKKEEEAKLKNQEKIEIFNKDLVATALGKEPEDDKKKEGYQEKAKVLKDTVNRRENSKKGNQQAALLSYLQGQFK